MRYLGIDHGAKRIGLSVGDDGAGIASPLSVVQASGDRGNDIRAILKVAREFEVEAFVIGLPANMDGLEGKQARIVRAFGDALAKASDKMIHYFDERLSSRAADELLQGVGLTRGKKKVRQDAVAAQVILQGFLDSIDRAPGFS